MCRRHEIYRATGFVLLDLIQDTQVPVNPLQAPLQAKRIRELYEAVDTPQASTASIPST
jgi:hypothetical protein